MKKIILIISLLFMSMITFAKSYVEGYPQIKDTLQSHTEIVSNPSPEFQKANDYIDGVITGLSKHLKVPAEHVYQVVLNQQKIVAKEIIITYILLVIVLLIVIICYIILEYNDSDNAFGWLILMIVLIIISIIVFLCTFDDLLTALSNPEYGAINAISKFIH